MSVDSYIDTWYALEYRVLPTRVQILVQAHFSEFSRIYRHYALSGKRRSDLPVLSPPEVLIGVGFAYVYSLG
jgi:hypothetical protein